MKGQQPLISSASSSGGPNSITTVLQNNEVCDKV